MINFVFSCEGASRVYAGLLLVWVVFMAVEVLRFLE